MFDPRAAPDLNPAQREAVTCGDGPVLVVAGAGTGKTWTLACRVAHLIQCGVPPERILLLTFSRRAAREMLARADQLIGGGQLGRAGRVWGGTFHAIANRLLRLYGRPIGVPPDFTILDQADMADLLDLLRGELGLGSRERRFPRKDTLAAVYSRAVNARAGLSRVLEQHFPWCLDEVDGIRALFERYTRRKRDQRVLDYDDLLLFWRALAASPAGQPAADRFAHVLVDEYQDTNPLQAEILLHLRRGNPNLMVVGDDAQCLPGDTLVLTDRGEVPIAEIRPGDSVVAAAGRGALATTSVMRVKKTLYVGSLVRVGLASGRTLLATPGHMCFARLSVRPNLFYVYLMYRRDKGYRVGVTPGGRASRRSGKSNNGIMTRTNQEHADRAWILHATASREEAHYYEQLYALRFGIPTTCFHPNGRAIIFSQRTINKLFTEVDTRANAEVLMRELHLAFEYPHHFSAPVSDRWSPTRVLVHLGLFAHTGRMRATPWASHRVWVQTSHPAAKEKLATAGFRIGRRDGRSWTIGHTTRDMGQAERLATQLSEAIDSQDVSRWACLTREGRFAFQPASHLRPTMLVPAIENDAVEADEIVSVDAVPFEGYVYDLDVADLHNYIANGLVVHNSIYGFRSASVRNMLDFPRQFPGARVVTLEQNYRSTAPILAVSNRVIEAARERYAKHLVAVRSGGGRPVLLVCADETDQAVRVCEHVLEHREQGTPLRQQAVLFRSSHHSDLLELELGRRNIPFVKYGGLKFLEAAHVKDLLALLRILENPRDEVSWFRVLQLLDGVGPAGARSISRALGVGDQPPPASGVERSPVRQLVNDPPVVAPVARQPLASLGAALADCLDAQSPPAAQVARLRRFYEPILERRYSSPASRVHDLEQLEHLAGGSASRGRFLAELTLDPPSSTSDLAGPPLRDEDYLVLSTIHSAKGGEWDVVHLISAADGMIPSDLATGDQDSIEEERRLLYVALTRARDALYVTAPLRFYNNNNQRPRGLDDAHHFGQLSRFLSPDVRRLFDARTTRAPPEAEAGAGADWPLPPGIRQPTRHRAAEQVDAYLAGLWRT